jgi:hypothetical protein
LFRNGGHITPVLYAEYSELKERYGLKTAKMIIRFRLGHLQRIMTVASEEGLLEQSQCREVEAFDVFHDLGLFKEAKNKLHVYKEDLPAEAGSYKVYEDLAEFKVDMFSKVVLHHLLMSLFFY